MNQLTFFLSGEHSTVPYSEVVGSIEAENYDFIIDEELDQVLTVRTDAEPSVLSGRLGMCHWIGEYFFSSEVDFLEESIGSSDLIDFLPQSKSIAVRVKRVKEYLKDINTQEIAKKIADILMEESDYEVDLEYPDNEIRVILTEGKCVLSIIREKVKRTDFEKRKPPQRAAVHPSTMQPNLARALVNLARTPREGRFLDPFCGVGGILIEAGLIGAEPLGVDIKPELVEGARKNLKEAGINEFELQVKNAEELEIENVDAIATDPPYGRQASTGGSDLRDLYANTFPVLVRTLKPGRYLCITAPEGLNLEEIAKNYPVNMEEKHNQRVHKSLARNIYVFKRENN